MLRIYNTTGHQVFPETGDAAKADGEVVQLIEDSVELFIDLDSCRIIVLVQADSPSVTSRQRSHFHAEFVADELHELFPGLVRGLEALEQGENSKNQWEFFRDKPELDLPWLLETTRSKSLTELGIQSGQEFTIEQLLKEGASLDFGISNYKAAVFAVNYLVHQVQPNATIAIASSGRWSAETAANLILQPGDYSNFQPLNESTERTVIERHNNIEEEIREEYLNAAEERVRAIIEDDRRTAWQIYTELSRLENFIQENTRLEETSIQFDYEKTRYIAELITGMRTGAAPTGLHDPGLLEDDVRSEIVERVIGEVEQSKQMLEEQMEDRVREEMMEEIRALSRYDPPIENSSLGRLWRWMSGSEREVSGTEPEEVKSVGKKMRQLEQNSTLSTRERTRIKRETKERIEDRRDELETARREEYDQRFEKGLDELEFVSTEDFSELGSMLADIKEVLNDPSAGYDDGNAVVKEFEQLSGELRNDDILDTPAKSELRSSFVRRISEYESTKSEQAATRIQQQLETKVDVIAEKGPDESSKEVIPRLRRAERLRSGDTDVKIDNREVALFAHKLKSLEEHPLISKQKKTEIEREIRKEIADEIAAIQKSRADSLKESVRRELNSFVETELEDRSARATIESLEKVRERLDLSIERISPPQNPKLEPLMTEVERIHRYRDDDIIDRERTKEVLGEVKKELDEQIEKIRDNEYEEIKGEFITTFEDLSQDSDVEPADKVKLLLFLEEYFLTGELNNSYSFEERITNYGKKIQNIYSPSSSVLKQGQIDDLKADLKSEVKEKLEEEREKYYTTQFEQFRFTVERILEEHPVNTSESGENRINILEDIQKSLYQNSIRSSVDDEINDILANVYRKNVLDGDRKERFGEEADSFLEEKIEESKRRRSDILAEEVRNKKTRIKDGSTKNQIRYLQGLKQILLGNSTRVELPVDTQNLHRWSTGLTDDKRREIISEIDADVDSLSEELARSIVLDIEDDLDQYIENDAVAAPAEGLTNFHSYIQGGQEKFQKGMLSSPADHFSQLESLYRQGIVQQAHFEGAKDDIETYLREIGDQTKGPDADGIRARLPSMDRRRMTLLTAGVGILVVVAIAASATGLGATIFGGGGGPNDVEGAATTPITGISVDVVRENSTEIKIEGEVGGGYQNVLLAFENHSSTESVAVEGGSFSGSLSVEEAGKYTVVATPLVDGERGDQSLRVTTTVPRTTTPTLELREPNWGESVDQTLAIRAETDGERYTIHVANESGDVVSTSSGAVTNGQVNTTVTFDEPGEYHVLLVVTNGDSLIRSEFRQVTVVGNTSGRFVSVDRAVATA